MKIKKFNIFTKIGRLNRRLSKYDKIMENIEYLKLLLESLDNRWEDALFRAMERFAEHDASNFDYDAEEDCSESDDECIIECDSCHMQFNIMGIDPEIDPETEEHCFTCPYCNFKNKLDFTDENEEFIDNSDTCQEINESEVVNTNNDESIENLDEDSHSHHSKTIKIPRSRNKSTNVTINNTSDVFIKGIIDLNNIKNAFPIVLEADTSNIEKMIESFANTGITFDKKENFYSCNKFPFSIIMSDNEANKITGVNFGSVMRVIPHGSIELLYRRIISELNVELLDPKFENIGLPGKAVLIKTANGNAALNINIISKDKVLEMTLIYNIDEPKDSDVGETTE